MKESLIKIFRSNLFESENIEMKNFNCKIKYSSYEEKELKLDEFICKRLEDGKLYLAISGDSDKIKDCLKIDIQPKTEENGFFLEKMPLVITELKCGYEEKSFFFKTAYINHKSERITDNKIQIVFYGINEIEEINFKDSKQEESSLKEWFINGITNDLFFFSDHYLEEWGISFNIQINKDVIEEKKFDFPKYSYDAAKFNLQNFQFAVVKIDENFIQRGLYILYKKEWGGIPSVEIREKIQSILSFIFARQLIKIGETKYDEHHYTIKSKKISYNISQQILRNGQEKFYPEFYQERDISKSHLDFKKNIEKIIDNFLINSDHYKIEFLLRKYYAFINPEIFLDYSIPIMCSGLEILSNIIAKDENKSKIISEERFRNFYREIESGIPPELERKILDLNSQTIGNKLKNLIEKFNLNYNDYKVIFDARNALIHGRKISEIDIHLAYKKLLKLFQLLILKVLDYDGVVLLSQKDKNAKIYDFKSEKEIQFILNY